MTSKLGITVALDLSSESALIAPEGRLTVGNAPSLIAVGRRASLVGHGLEVIMDLRKLTAAEAGAVAMVRDSGWQGSQLLGGRIEGWDRAA